MLTNENVAGIIATTWLSLAPLMVWGAFLYWLVK